MTTSTSIGGSTTTMSQELLDTMNGTNSSSSSASSSSGTSASDLQTTFLQLLVTQLQNQDPTNPMDSSQMTSQLAQIDTVSGISQLNTSLSSLSTQLSASQNAQAALLIGASVLAPGSSVAVSDGAASELGVQLSSAATDVKLTVTNSSGKVVNTIDLGAQAAGTVQYGWTPTDSSGNTLADGTYTISATATGANGTTPTATALVPSTVESVVQQSDGSAGLSLSNGTTVGLSSIASIL